MIRQLKYILLIVLIISCKNNSIDKPKKPDNLIPKDSMVEILYDISLVSSAKGVNKKLMEKKGLVPEYYIYKKHNIDSLQFALSNEYYAFNIETYEDIYKSVKIKLEKDKKHFQKIIEVEQKAKDSLNKIKKRVKDSLKKTQKLDPINEIKNPNLKKTRLLKKIDSSQLSTRQ